MSEPSQELLDMVAARDFIDFPTAWALARSGLPHWTELCSYVQTDGALLCDCDAIYVRWWELREQLGLPVSDRVRTQVRANQHYRAHFAPAGGEPGVQ